MAIIDLVRWSPNNETLLYAYRFPETNLSTYTQLLVYESQQALLFSKEKELIAIYFTTTYKTNYTEENHPINIINYEINNLNLDKQYSVTKYLLVGQNNGQFESTKGDVKVLSYEELIIKEKNKINLF